MTRTAAHPIRRPRLDEDVVPFTDCRRTLSDCMERTARTHRPIVITHNGRAASVMIGIADFEDTWNEVERWRESAELSRAVEISRRQFEEGKFKPHNTVWREMRSMLDGMKARGETR